MEYPWEPRRIVESLPAVCWMHSSEWVHRVPFLALLFGIILRPQVWCRVRATSHLDTSKLVSLQLPCGLLLQSDQASLCGIHGFAFIIGFSFRQSGKVHAHGWTAKKQNSK
eukprot:797220-Amphidinium_carterae.2